MEPLKQSTELPTELSLHLTCLNTIKNPECKECKEEIIGYTLANLDNKAEIREVRDVNVEALKRAIRNKQVTVDNLELTLYGKLVYKDKQVSAVKVKNEQSQSQRDTNKVILTKHSMNLLKEVLMQYKLTKEAVISFKNNQNIGAVRIKAQLLGVNVVDIYDIRGLILIKDNNVEVPSAGELYLPQNSSQLFYGYICKGLDLSNIRTDDMGISVAMFINCRIDELNLQGWKNPG